MKNWIPLTLLAALLLSGCDGGAGPDPEPPQVTERFDKRDITVGNGPFALLAEDFDGDGSVDLAVSNTDDGTVSILANSAGNFALAALVGAGTNPAALTATDFDGDGHPDIAIANEGENRVEGTKDGMVMIVQNTSAPGSFGFTTKTTLATGADPYGITSVDLDGDGDMDLAVTDREPSGKVHLLRNDGAFSFVKAKTLAIGGDPRLIVSDDFNGDGRMDLAIAVNTDGVVAILENTTAEGAATFSFQDPILVPLSNGPSALIATHLTGDDLPDLAVTDAVSNVWILKNTSSAGSISFSPSSIPVGSGPFGITAAELEGDADIDLVVTNETSGDLSFLLNDGTGAFQRFELSFPVGKRPFGITNAALGGDDKADLVVSTRDDNSISVLIGMAFLTN